MKAIWLTKEKKSQSKIPILVNRATSFILPNGENKSF